MTKEDRDRQLKDINQKRIDLGDLAVKLGSFIGGEGKVSEAIKKAIEAYEKQHKDCDSCKQSCKSLDNCSCSNGCQSIMDQWKKLKNFEETNKSNKNNPNELLENLCDGLEKFLGYDKNSKGYDGSGIVYSDLDRLCDAVMAFLSGVLGAVKNENEVTTYDTNPTNNINTVINTLNNEIGSGREGLAESVTLVKGWLEKYFKIYINKTDFVTGHLGRLIGDLHSVSGDYYKRIVDGSCKNLKEQLKEWNAIVHNIDAQLSSIENDIINMLDPFLHKQLLVEVRHVKKVIAHMNCVAFNDDVTRQLTAVDYYLFEEKDHLDKEIVVQSNQLQQALVEEFGKMIAMIGNLRVVKKQQFSVVRDSIKQARIRIQGDLDKLTGSSRNDIYKKFDEIKEKLQTVDPSKQNPSHTRSTVVAVRSYLADMNHSLRLYYTELENWIDGVKGLIDDVCHKDVDPLVTMTIGNDKQKAIAAAAVQIKVEAAALHGGGKMTKDNIGALVKEVKSKIEPFENIYRRKLLDIKKKIDQAVGTDVGLNTTGILKSLNELNDKVKWGLWTIRNKIKTQMQQQMELIISGIRTEVKTIIHGDNETSKTMDGLQGIKTKIVMEWAKGFENYESKVQDWITKILTDNAIVKERLTRYINTYKWSFKDSLEGQRRSDETGKILPQVTSIVKRHIESKLGGVIGAAKQQMSTTGENLYAYVAAVAKCCQSFVSQLEEEVGSNIKVESIVTDVHGEIIKPSEQHNCDKSYLYEAITATLASLSASAKRISVELASLALERNRANGQMSNATLTENLDKTLQLAEQLDNKLDKSGKTTGDNFAENVRTQVNTVLNKQIGDAAGNEKIELREGSDTGLMSDYMKQTKKGDDGGSSGNDGDFRAAIKNITKMLHDITENGSTVINDIQGRQDAYDQLNDTIDRIQRYVTDALRPVDELKSALVKHAGNVETHFTKLMGEISDTGASVLTHFNYLKETSIDDQLTAIKNKIVTLQSRMAQDAIDTGINTILDKVDELEAVPKFVDKNKEEVDGIMEQLRTVIAAIITAIDLNINEADEELERIINRLIIEVTECEKNLKKSINALKSHLRVVVDTAFAVITNEVQLLYANGHKADLQAVEKLIIDEKSAIQTIIEKDESTTIKGLLKSIKGSPFALSKYGIPKFNESPKTNLLEPLKGDFTPANFNNLPEKLKSYADNVLNYIQDHVKNPPQPRSQLPSQVEVTEESEKVGNIMGALDDLLGYLTTEVNPPRSYIFDHTYTNLHESLSTSLSALHPSHFANPRHPELLDAVRAGLQGFVKEMGRVYVNGYEGSGNVTFFGYKTKLMTDDAKNCAKIFLTIMPTLYVSMRRFYDMCNEKGPWREMKIHLGNVDKRSVKPQIPAQQKDQIVNALGTFLERCGYRVPTDKDEQNGELRNTVECTGETIHNLCRNEITGLNDGAMKLLGRFADSSRNSVRLINLLLFLHTLTLPEYYKVCHLNYRPNPKPPTTIYQMMQWLPGLVYSPMFGKVCDYAKELFGKPKGEEAKKYSEIATTSLTLSATSEIKYDDVKRKIANACLYSHDTLVAILGNGHAGGRYAVDFCTNEDNFIYPSSPSSCFDMLVDILNRVYFQLYFLYKQCHNGRSSGGWEDCYYGRHVGGSAWTCNEEQCGNLSCPQKTEQTSDRETNQIADQNGKQTAGQTADQTCKQHPTCGVKSPLQSYLEDGLQGFLPHQLTKVGCGVKCLVTNHFGKPCLTPMGFSDIGIAASHTKHGKYLKQALHNFCSSNTHLSELCGMLNCLLRQAPQTLGDMFAFYYNFLHNWNSVGQVHKRDAYVNAITEANFGDSKTTLDVVSIQSSSTHDNHVTGEDKHLTGDLLSLIQCKSKVRPIVPCGAYLQSITEEIRMVFAKDHAGDYVSWVVYTTETFYDLLQKLYDECCNSCNKKGSRCRDRSCVDDCQVNYYYKYKKPTPQQENGALIGKIKHEKLCSSIVQCRNTYSAIYTAGFTFGNPVELSDSEEKTKRTCQDFCTALANVVKEGNLIYMLVHKHIPNFLFAIRAPFIWLNVALWLLCLLYLLHIMVIRLDLLHIKSHLHSPSSHRIAAQSLLAAARVNKLNRVFYLQP